MQSKPKHTEAGRQRIGDAKRGIPKSPEHREKIAAANRAYQQRVKAALAAQQ